MFSKVISRVFITKIKTYRLLLHLCMLITIVSINSTSIIICPIVTVILLRFLFLLLTFLCQFSRLKVCTTFLLYVFLYHFFSGTADEISDWLIKEVNRIRTVYRAPLTLLVNSYWFEFTEHSYEALKQFLVKAVALKDIFFVSQSQVIDFMKNPIKLKDYKTPKPDHNARCQAQECIFKEKDRYMKSCTPCPDEYPWLDNPEGKKQ